LAFLCLEHHSLYDSRTRQHKNFTADELKAARTNLYAFVQTQTCATPRGGTGGPINQSGGVNFGVASNVHVFGDIVAGNKVPHQSNDAVRERGEELYGHIDKWANFFACHYLRLAAVMQGKLTYNQCLDLDIAEGNKPATYDFGPHRTADQSTLFFVAPCL